MNRYFFKQDAVTLAKDLLGKMLVRKVEGRIINSLITETEAYVGPEDKGSHAYNNKRTKRTETMFKEGGHAYIYLIYGMYNCLNIVCSEKDKPEAVLIRAVEPLNEIEYIRMNRKIKSNKVEDLTNGPGKLCQALDIDTSLDGIDLLNNSVLYIQDNLSNHEIVASKRINIDYAGEYANKLWRFYIKGNKFISKK
ncbi:DNA-3-methyladenine glycosylase [Geotoga petraea]|jgi:DNA-3-methyladenine glycosylase|uniref:Putative 3-methyladenine DNA glycosylase n=1 Tax=Geotoga petraea TaxID=28234 RepID=A0A1G6KUE6_9BACT|nr:DNA-3-methyladenine glycosylase [Geotoga petraea]TGG88744.1 DNA-3-methyladenine glycosylase [Geotoga petraea]SDC34700.1 DNA-3-methyladenine glycosylase [Geotoga petraea]